METPSVARVPDRDGEDANRDAAKKYSDNQKHRIAIAYSGAYKKN